MVNKKRSVILEKYMKVIWAMCLLVLWESITRLGLVNPLSLPAASDVARRLGSGLINGDLGLQLIQSLGIIFLGLAISTVLVLVMVYLDYFYMPFRHLFELLSAIFHPLPGIAMLPVIMIWFSAGYEAALVVIIHAALWSMYLTLKKGFENVDISLIEAARNNGASNNQLYRYVLMACARGDLITGIQIGWSRGWRGLIGAEMVFGAISALGGIGWFMVERRAFMDITGMYAGIVLIACVGVVVEEILFNRYLHQDYIS